MPIVFLARATLAGARDGDSQPEPTRDADSFVEERKEFGITADYVYRDVRDPNAALVHLVVDDASRASEWFQTDKFKTATAAAKVTDRAFYMAEKRG